MSSQRGFNTVVGVFVLLFFITTVVGGVFLWKTSRDTKTARQTPINSSGGVVTVFDQSGSQSLSVQPTTAGNQENQTNPNPEPQVAAAQTTYSTLPYVFDLPDGWSIADTKTERNPCGGDDSWLTTTYVNGQESITVYENGTPAGCANEIVADVYLDFNYSADGSSITIDPAQAITQCSKEENPACPKGDGKVSVFIGNESSEQANKQIINQINGRSYMFSIVDTKFDGNLEAQVKSLLEIIKVIKFQ